MWTLVPGYHQELFAFIPGSADSSMAGGADSHSVPFFPVFPGLSVQAIHNSSFFSLSFFFQSYKIVDIKLFGVFLLPLLGIDLYALYAGLKKMQI